MEDYYKAVDALIRYLNTSEIKEWKESRAYKMSQLLLIRSGADFDTYFPIDKSERTFMLLLPFDQGGTITSCEEGVWKRMGYALDYGRK